MSTNACQCERCTLVELILDRLEASGAVYTKMRRLTTQARVREWVGKGYTLACVESAIARARAGREAEGSKTPINPGLVENLMRGGRYVPLSVRYPAVCPFIARAGELPYRGQDHDRPCPPPAPGATGAPDWPEAA